MDRETEIDKELMSLFRYVAKQHKGKKLGGTETNIS